MFSSFNTSETLPLACFFDTLPAGSRLMMKKSLRRRLCQIDRDGKMMTTGKHECW
jgi:hypothetical protein